MRKMPGKSVLTMHKEIAKDQFNALDYKGKDIIQFRRAFIYQYFKEKEVKK